MTQDGDHSAQSTPGNGSKTSSEAHLRRVLTLPLVVLYGLGVTIGAGIYVLTAETAARAGVHAPLAFVLAALVMAPSAGSFAYVREGFHSNLLSLLVGLMVVAAGSVSAATVSVGCAGYIREFLALPNAVLVPIIVLAIGAVAAWGILESVTFAAIFTLVEIGGLLLIIAGGFAADPEILLRLPEVIPPLNDPAAWIGVGSAGLLAFFAFIGFEDLVNVAEEVKRPERTLPRAIFLTLIITTLAYVLVISISVLSVRPEELGVSEAPLSLVFERTTGLSPAAVTLIAIVATLNGAIINMIMASRVIYGLSRQGNLPEALGRVNRITRTPLTGTTLVVAIILLLAIAFPLDFLAETTSRITLSVFAVVNLALLRLKLTGSAAAPGHFTVPTWVPVAGFLSCLALLSSDFLS
jgi:amino acid transporter